MAIKKIKKDGGPWNKGKLVGAKKALDQDQLIMLRHRLTADGNIRELAIMETAISTMLRGCDLRRFTVGDVRDSTGAIKENFLYKQLKTSKGVTVPLTSRARGAIATLIAVEGKISSDYLFTRKNDPHGDGLTTKSIRLFVKRWAGLIGADPSAFSSHSLRRTRAAAIYKATGNLRAVQLLLGHSTMAATQRYLGIETDDALRVSAQNEI